MADSIKVGVAARIAEFERADRSRLWESTVKPMAESTGKDGVSVPALIDMFVKRFDDLERSMEKSRRDLALQVEAVRIRARRSWWATVALVVATAALVAVIPRLTLAP